MVSPSRKYDAKTDEDSPKATQLALPVRLADEATLANFASRAALEPLLYALKCGAARDFEPLSFLHGPADGGKSHLLQALCHRRDGAVYLPLCAVHELPPAPLLAGLERAPLLAFDDLERVAGRPDWEEALFELINRARPACCSLWFAARQPPATLPVQLADLRSRLGGGLTWAVPAPSDEEKVALLMLRARRLGLNLPESVAVYLCRRASRALKDLLACLDRLDEASLRQQRPITLPLAQKVLGLSASLPRSSEDCTKATLETYT